MTSDTQKTTLFETEKKIHDFVQKRNAKNFAERVSELIGGSIFFAIAVLTTYLVLVMLEEGLWYFEPLTKAWNWFSGIVIKPEHTWVNKMWISIGIMYAVPLGINFVLSFVAPFFYIKKKFKTPENKSNIERINSMEAKLNATSGSGTIIVFAFLHFLFFAISIGYLVLRAEGFRIDNLSELLGILIGFAVILAIAALITAILFGLFWIINIMLFMVKSPTKLLEEVEALKKCELSRIEKEKAEMRRREEEEKAQRKLEEKKRIEKEKKEKERIKKEQLKKAEDLYNKALEGETPDESLLEEAARLGNPEASKYLGGKYVMQWSIDEGSNIKKEKILRKAEGFLSVFADGGDPTGEFLWLFCNCMLNSHKHDEWIRILRRLERIEDSGNLSKEYAGTIGMLINEVDKQVKMTESKKVVVEKEDYSNVSFDCEFRNGAICTKGSTSTYLAKCNYVNNPTSCSTAVFEKGIYVKRH